ncbi:centrosome-associated protein cep250-like isoform x1 [Plakobranchus ocellatus]|uniref:Centrosome-associated protein cep250-like isoform x1 n=1 Tax=Plakobranchus ocellatus TaxID=259542 RepID=A0AAV3ZTU7_9GAST|nr:centrosome-associated protein cep250-like isoform x1 [Plakobranchus ocellatus]
MWMTWESRPSTKDTRTSTSKSGGGAKNKAGGRSPTRSKDGKSGSKSGGGRSVCSRSRENTFTSIDSNRDKEFAEIAIQDEGGDHASATVDEKSRTPATRVGRRSKSNLAPVLESDLDSAFDLFDDQAWAAVPKEETTGRFAQYRRLSTNRMQELEDQLNLVTAKTRRKVATLKAQFQEHKSKWEAERRVLIEQVDQSIKLQGDAEKEADAAMTQLEDFITEQERLEQEEEQQRSEALQASASLTPISNAAMTPVQGRSTEHTPTAGTPLPHQKEGGMTPDPEGELQRLMQQTDDAKSARQGDSGPASAITRSSSSGSVLVGRGLLDVTKPFKESSPTPEPPSGEVPSAPTPNKKSAGKKSPTEDEQTEVTIVPAPMEVSEETLNEVGLRITPENGHVAPLLVETPREERATETKVGGKAIAASGQPMPPPGAEGAPVVLLVMPEKEEELQVEADGSVHVQALIPPSIVTSPGGDVKGHAPAAVLEAKVIPQRDIEEAALEGREREGTSSSFASRGESSFVVDASGDERRAGPPSIVQIPASVSPRASVSSSPRIPREAIAAPRRSVSELSAPVVARLDLLSLMKGRAKSAGIQSQKVKPVPAPLAKTPAQHPLGMQREGIHVSAQPEAVVPPAGMTTIGLDGIEIDVTTPRNVAQVHCRSGVG